MHSSKSAYHQLLGVTYSQFDNTVGPQLLYEYPKGTISPDAFEAVSEYVIVGKHLCEKIIMVKVDNIKFLNFSVAIENSKVWLSSAKAHTVTTSCCTTSF